MMGRGERRENGEVSGSDVALWGNSLEKLLLEHGNYRYYTKVERRVQHGMKRVIALSVHRIGDRESRKEGKAGN